MGERERPEPKKPKVVDEAEGPEPKNHKVEDEEQEGPEPNKQKMGVEEEEEGPEPQKQKVEDEEEEGPEPNKQRVGVEVEEEGPEPQKQQVEEEEEEEEVGEEEAFDARYSVSVFDDVPACGVYPLDDIEDGLRELYLRYNEVVEKSNGFESLQLPSRPLFFGMINPIDMDDPYWTEDLKECGEFAMEEYNKGRIKPYCKLTSAGHTEEEGDLVFQKVTKANVQGGGYLLYYITFKALDTLSGKSSDFQAKVSVGPADLKKVLFFRPMPLQYD